MTVVTMRKLLEAGVHYGHQTRRWDPRMKANIYAAKNGVHIIDLAKTVDAVDEAYGAMKAIAEKGGRVLFVGTKKQAQAIVMEEALRSGSFHVTQRWLGGTFENYTKKEVAGINKEKARLDNFLGGIKEMKKLPDAVFVVDPKEDYNAVLEARKLHIPVFGICDTNCDPALVDYAIPGNDDAVKAIKLLVGVMADAIVEAKGGLLEFAYVADEQPEVSMEDVIINVQEVAAENERRRRARFEEKRAQQNARNNRRPRRFENKEAAPAAEAPAASEAIEVAEPVVEATEETNE